MKFSIVIPCYNEAGNIPTLLERCQSVYKLAPVEFIIVDNGSTDSTPELLPQLLEGISQCRSVRVDFNKGYGHGILAGIAVAAGDVIGWTHADLQTDPKCILQALNFFAKHEVIFVKGRRKGRPFFDNIFTIGMSVFETLLFGSFLWDINAQPTLLSRQLLESWQSPPNDFSLDLFAYQQAKNLKVKVRRFPVIYFPRLCGTSSWNVSFRARLKFIKRTVTYSLKLRMQAAHENNCAS